MKTKSHIALPPIVGYHARMKKALIALLIMVLSIVVYAVPNPLTVTVDITSQPSPDVTVYRNTQRTIRVTINDGGSGTVNMTGTTNTFQILSSPYATSTVASVTGSFVNGATNGVLDFILTTNHLAVSDVENIYRVMVADSNGVKNVWGQGVLIIKPSPTGL